MSQQDATSQAAVLPGSARTACFLMLFMFFLSGFAALIYQIVWARQLMLVFGVTIYATSAVVTAFMAGLALGSLYFGRLVDRWKRPLLLFAFLEVGIAVFALLFPAITLVLKRVYVPLYGALGDSHYVMSLVRFVLSFLVLLVPTSLMGGTLPVIARAYVSRSKRVGGDVAGLYSVNNLGAFLGCVLAGYLFIELIGLSGALRLAALVNVAVAAIALCLDARFRSRPERQEPDAETGAAREGARLPGPVKVALWVFGIEGFTSLVYQMAWMRMLMFFVETNIYAVTAIVATFLVGLSAGAFVVKRWVDRTRDPYRMLGVIEVGIAVTALMTIALLPWMVGFYNGLRGALMGWGWWGWTAARFGLACVVILVPTGFMGATIAVVARIYVRGLGGLGRKMGVIGCLDTVGSVLGAFAGGFVLIPLLGIQRTIIATALINLALAAWVFAANPLGRRTPLLRAGFLTAVGGLLLVPVMLLLKPMPLVLCSPVLENVLQREVLYYDEDAESSVSVVEQYGLVRTLFVDYSAVGDTSRHDRPSHELIGHVPLLLHPDPKRALLIGFGMGLTASACRAQGVEVDVVELSPGVARANSWFAEYSDQILSDPNVHLYIDDGRNYVLGTRQRYDMIQAGIVHPGVSSGNAGFYTTDFYRDCKRILTPDGVMCQWLPLHGIPHESFKMLIRSFLEEFPHTSIWYKYSSDFCALIGTPEPLKIDFQDIQRRVDSPVIRERLARTGVVDVYDLLDSFCVGGDAIRRAVGPGVVDRDDRPRIEFRCNRPVLGTAHPENIRFLGSPRQRVWSLLVNVPVQTSDEVRTRLERWFTGTQHLIRAQHAAVVLQSIGIAHEQYWPVFEDMEAGFQRTRQVNPEDRNARFLWGHSMAFHELRMARQSDFEGRHEEALRHWARAIEVAPGTYPAAMAKFLYETTPASGTPP
ncbi:MAG: fused MFS/spermidine synthase [Candidatus Brocadiae bacterium]|nr:fused MFS/spermidine synthase [Candidatus Brocadiia bacterium]